MRGVLVLRRELVVTAAGALASYTTPRFEVVSASPVPPSAKIQRLLLWLPPSDQAADTTALADGFKAKLAALGIPVTIGRSNALELERADDQKPYIAGFKPTHRLEIGVA